MKFDQRSISLIVVAASMSLAVQGYNSCHNNGRLKISLQGRTDFIHDEERVNEAFKELKQELDHAGEEDDGYNKFNDGEFCNEEEESSARDFSRKKQQEWVNKAFEFASGLNADFAASDDEANQNQKDIDQVKSWINRIYDMGNTNTGNDEKTTYAEEEKDSSKVVEPPFKIHNTLENWMCSLDVPGVERSNVDIRFDDDNGVLVIEGERHQKFGGDDDVEPITYRKKFKLEDERIETDKISAQLENGVLTLSAPKKKIEEDKSRTRKIPIL